MTPTMFPPEQVRPHLSIIWPASPTIGGSSHAVSFTSVLQLRRPDTPRRLLDRVRHSRSSFDIGFAHRIQPYYFTAAVTWPVAQAVLTLVLAVPQLAVCIKRFRDLEWPAWVAYALVGQALPLRLRSTRTSPSTEPLATSRSRWQSSHFCSQK